MDRYMTLAELVVDYCELRSLDLDHYVLGMGPVEGRYLETLIRYHREWMRNG